MQLKCLFVCKLPHSLIYTPVWCKAQEMTWLAKPSQGAEGPWGSLLPSLETCGWSSWRKPFHSYQRVSENGSGSAPCARRWGKEEKQTACTACRTAGIFWRMQSEFLGLCELCVCGESVLQQTARTAWLCCLFCCMKVSFSRKKCEGKEDKVSGLPISKLSQPCLMCAEQAELHSCE